MSRNRLTAKELYQLSRWNTPTIYNGWEAITSRSSVDPVFNREETRDFMPDLGPMVGYAVTVVIEPSNPSHPRQNPDGWTRYWEHVLEAPGPKVVVVQDLDRPETYGAFWGEVNSNIHLALGCIGSVADAAIRDVDEVTRAGFKVIARRLSVGHAYSFPVRWNVPVEVFGCPVEPGQLIHADRHGFMAIPDEDVPKLLDASVAMDRNEANTVIPAAKAAQRGDGETVLTDIKRAAAEFHERTTAQFGEGGEF